MIRSDLFLGEFVGSPENLLPFQVEACRSGLIGSQARLMTGVGEAMPIMLHTRGFALP